MADGKVLEFAGVTKVFGDVAAVSELTARIEPGSVTAFLGPNGAGKTTTLRILLGQLRPTSGQATIGGVPYARIPSPARTVGWVGEAEMAFRPRRTAVRHLTAVAKSAGVTPTRVREVLDLVGLADVADMRIGGYSLGMRQRLSVAQALLGDPGVLVFDEPANGLDPEGIRWMRLLMRSLADEGRTVLMSSHLLSEVQQIADRILIMSNGHLVFNGGIEQLAEVESPVVAVDSPDRAGLSRLLRERGFECEVLRSGLNVRGAAAEEIGLLAASAGIPLSTLHQRTPSLEDVFLDLVSGRRTQQTAALGGPAAPAVPATTQEPAAPETAGAADADAAPTEESVAEAPVSGPEPTGDPDAEVDLAEAAGLGGAAAVAGLAGAAATAFAADATTDPEPLPGARALAEERAAGEAERAARADDEAAPGDDAAEADDTAPTGTSGRDGSAAETPASDAEATTGPEGSTPSFAEVLAAVRQDEPELEEAGERATASEAAPAATEDAPADGTESVPAQADAAALPDEQDGSPWSVGASFADRLGGAGDPASAVPDEQELPHYLLETQALDVVARTDEPASDAPEAEIVGDAEIDEAPAAAAEDEILDAETAPAATAAPAPAQEATDEVPLVLVPETAADGETRADEAPVADPAAGAAQAGEGSADTVAVRPAGEEPVAEEPVAEATVAQATDSDENDADEVDPLAQLFGTEGAAADEPTEPEGAEPAAVHDDTASERVTDGEDSGDRDAGDPAQRA